MPVGLQKTAEFGKTLADFVNIFHTPGTHASMRRRIQCAARLTRHRASFDFSVPFLLRLSLLLGLIALLTAR